MVFKELLLEGHIYHLSNADLLHGIFGANFPTERDIPVTYNCIRTAYHTSVIWFRHKQMSSYVGHIINMREDRVNLLKVLT